MSAANFSPLMYLDVNASLQRFCNLFAEDPANAIGASYYEFDAHADGSDIPEGDLIGLSGLSMGASEYPFQEINVMVGYATDNDTNLKRLRLTIAKLYQRLQIEQRIDLVNYETGEVNGYMVVSEVRILPVGGNDSKPLIFIMVGFKTDCFVG